MDNKLNQNCKPKKKVADVLFTITIILAVISIITLILIKILPFAILAETVINYVNIVAISTLLFSAITILIILCISRHNPENSDPIKKKQIYYAQHPQCPMCHGFNTKRITQTHRVASTSVFGISSSTIGKQFTCNDCKYKW